MTTRVLLVDDVDDVRRLVRIALRFRDDVDVVGEAAAGLPAVELAAALQPDVVLLDLGLPDLAGKEVLTRIHAAAPGARIVIFTGSDDERPYYEGQGAAYVLKDQDLEHLLVAICEPRPPTAATVDDVAPRRAAPSGPDPADPSGADSRHYETHFASDVRSIAQARAWTRERSSRWLTSGQLDDLMVIVSELATNACRHAGTDFTVSLEVDPDQLRLAVADASHLMPEIQPFSDTAEGGRGLLLVSSLATSWGIEARTDGPGKQIWAVLAHVPA